MNNNEKKLSVCTTCLTFRAQRDSSFPVTEDIKEILRSLLYDFDIDAFFRSKPLDKEFALCRTCYTTLRDMIAFKERVLKSFTEFMKFWCVDEKQTTRNTVTAPCSSQTANLALIEVKSEESDPLEIKKLHTEYIHIDIKEETDISDINISDINKEETDISHINEERNIININEPEPVATILLKHETPTEYNNAETPQMENYTNNEKGKFNDEVFNLNVAPVSDNAVQHSNKFIINKETATNTSRNSSDSYYNQNIAVPSSSKLNSFVINKVTSMPARKNSSYSDNNVRRIIVIPANKKNIQNTSIVDNNAAVLTKNSNLSIGNNSFILNSEVTSDISHINNTAIVTKSKSLIEKSLLDILLEKKERKAKRENDQQVVVDYRPKMRKIVKIDGKGNVVSIGEGILKPLKSKKDKSTVQQPSTAKREPDTYMDLTADRGTASDTSATDSADESVHKKEPDMSILRNTNRKWYIKVVPREEILKKMEERRNDPKFLKAPYKCDSCVTEFYAKELAESHKETLHSKDFEFKCFACHSTFCDFKRLNMHYFVHMDTCVYYCTTCEFESKHHENLKDHVCLNAGSKSLPPKDRNTMKLSHFRSCYYCPKCEYLSTNPSSVVNHYNSVHKENQKVKCGKCSKFYKNKTMLTHHMRYAHRGIKPVREPVYCNICGKWYSDKTSHYTHMKYMHGERERKYECDECEKKFLTTAALKSHKAFHEGLKGGVKNHQCSTCGSAYYTKKGLRSHVLLKHENKKTSRDHVCEVCGKAFFTGTLLRDHSAKHSDERPYKCSYCGDTFKYSGALFTHTKLKHKKNKNSDGSTQEEKSKETSRKDKEHEKISKVKKKKRVKRKMVESSSSEEELTGFPDSWLNV